MSLKVSIVILSYMSFYFKIDKARIMFVQVEFSTLSSLNWSKMEGIFIKCRV